jgi:hypothetical protein
MNQSKNEQIFFVAAIKLPAGKPLDMGELPLCL